MFKEVFQKTFLRLILILSLLIICCPLTNVRADVPPAGTGTPPLTIQNPLQAESFTELAKNIATWMIKIGVPVAVIMIIYSALLFMTAAGNEEKITKAKKALMWSLIGLALLLSSRALIELIKNILGAG